MRPTHGILPTAGYIPSFEYNSLPSYHFLISFLIHFFSIRQFDVPTFFGRDLLKSKKFATAWYSRLMKEITPTVCLPSDTNIVDLCAVANYRVIGSSRCGVSH